jgi:hypothetical protein
MKFQDTQDTEEPPQSSRTSSSYGASTTSPPASDSRMDFPVLTALSIHSGGSRMGQEANSFSGRRSDRRVNIKQKPHQPLLMLLPSISFSFKLNV